MRPLVLLLSLLLPLPAFAAKVVATTPTLGALAREVAGPGSSVTVLASPKQDPHYVDPRPDLVLVLNDADLLVANGLDLEVGWLPTLQRGARNPRIQPGAAGFLDASTLVEKLDVPQAVDRAMGDIHPGGNPHYLLDPRAAAKVARGLGERLAAVDPGGAEGYRARASAAASGLEALAAAQAARFAALPEARRTVVAYHRSLPYLASWLGLTIAVEIEPKPGIPPDPAHVARVLQTMRARGVKVILQEAYYPSSTSKTLAHLGAAKLVLLPGGAAEGESAAAHYQALADELYRALAG